MIIANSKLQLVEEFNARYGAVGTSMMALDDDFAQKLFGLMEAGWDDEPGKIGDFMIMDVRTFGNYFWVSMKHHDTRDYLFVSLRMDGEEMEQFAVKDPSEPFYRGGYLQ